MQNLNQSQQDNKHASPSQRLRAYFNDFETKTVRDLLIKHNAVVKNYSTIKARLSSGCSIHEAVATEPSKVDGVENCTDIVVEFLNNNIGKWFTIAQIAKECGIIMLSAGRAYDVVAKFSHSKTMLKGSKKMIKITDFIDLDDEKDVKFKLDFVSKARNMPSIDKETINPNWFITKKLH